MFKISTFISFSCMLLLLVFSLASNPVSLVGLLILLSMMFVFMISTLVSSWYSYILFLIMIGGMLVMFIFICLISSNMILMVEIPWMIVSFFMVLWMNFFNESFNYSWNFLMNNDFGYMIPSVIIIILVMLLFYIFLMVVKIVKKKGSLEIEN